MILGRTNRSYAPIWARPIYGGDLEALLEYLKDFPGVIDATVMPAILGARISKPKRFLVRGGRAIANATSASHAADLLLAEVVSALSSLVTTQLEFFSLCVPGPLENHQVEGALGALGEAKQDGLIHSLGIGIEGPAALPLWQMNDAFDIAIVPAEGPFAVESNKLAVARRVGLVVDGEIADSGLTQIRTYANRP